MKRTQFQEQLGNQKVYHMDIQQFLGTKKDQTAQEV